MMAPRFIAPRACTRLSVLETVPSTPQTPARRQPTSRSRKPRTGPAAPRPPLVRARSCSLTALLPPAVLELLKEEIAQRLAPYFQAPQWNYPIWLFRDSEIIWGQRAQQVLAAWALRELSLEGLRTLLWYELERLARLVVERQPDHSVYERVQGIRGALRRVGQIYRELRWRCGEQRALWHLRLLLSALYWW